MKVRLEAAAKDDVVEVAAEALWMLGWFKEAADVDFLLARLEQVRGVDSLCASALFALGRTASPRALEAILPFTRDPRTRVRRQAVQALGEFRDEQAARRLAELVQSESEGDSSGACYAIGRSLYRNPGFKEIYDPALLAAARIATFKPWLRMEMAGEIKDPLMKVEACLAIFRQPSASRFTSAKDCRKEAARVLALLCPGKQLTVERLAELTKDPNVNLAELAAALLKKD